jgi:hypothetical protein
VMFGGRWSTGWLKCFSKCRWVRVEGSEGRGEVI